ncbi:hypothetical protein TNCV_841431 [Trichonephila clavipes]|nr:hypothetical protein TNCV_841431 [Trichonephila clavipes]
MTGDWLYQLSEEIPPPPTPTRRSVDRRTNDIVVVASLFELLLLRHLDLTALIATLCESGGLFVASCGFEGM